MDVVWYSIFFLLIFNKKKKKISRVRDPSLGPVFHLDTTRITKQPGIITGSFYGCWLGLNFFFLLIFNRFTFFYKKLSVDVIILTCPLQLLCCYFSTLNLVFVLLLLRF